MKPAEIALLSICAALIAVALVLWLRPAGTAKPLFSTSYTL